MHIKRHHETSPTDDKRETGTEGSTRRRVREACRSCRRRRIRCDGNEPCKACYSGGIPCLYSTPVASLPAINHAFHEPDITEGVLRRSESESYLTNDDDRSSSRPQPSPTKSWVSNNNISMNTTAGSVENIDPDAASLSFQVQAQGALSLYDSTTRNEPDLSLPDESVPFSLLDTTEMVDMWQMPSMVRTIRAQI